MPQDIMEEAQALLDEAQTLFDLDKDVAPWLEKRGLLPVPNRKGKYDYDKIKSKLIGNEEFRALSAFDKNRISAYLERLNDFTKTYSTTSTVSQNTKQSEFDEKTGKEKAVRIPGANIFGADPVRGCPRGQACSPCFGCSGGAKQARIRHDEPILAQIKGGSRSMKSGDVLRLGVIGEPAHDWEHTNEQIVQTQQRLADAGKDIDITLITKLQNLKGYDPNIAHSLQVSFDPVSPRQLRKTMRNVERLLQMSPKPFIAVRVRSLRSKNPEINQEIEKIIEFVNKYDLPVLETPLRFVGIFPTEQLELDMSQYYRKLSKKGKEAGMFRMKEPMLQGRVKRWGQCDPNKTGCPGCRKCADIAKHKYLTGEQKDKVESCAKEVLWMLEACKAMGDLPQDVQKQANQLQEDLSNGDWARVGVVTGMLWYKLDAIINGLRDVVGAIRSNK